MVLSSDSLIHHLFYSYSPALQDYLQVWCLWRMGRWDCWWSRWWQHRIQSTLLPTNMLIIKPNLTTVFVLIDHTINHWCQIENVLCTYYLKSRKQNKSKNIHKYVCPKVKQKMPFQSFYSCGLKLWWLTWFLAQNNTCVNICNTVYACSLKLMKPTFFIICTV